MAQPARRSGAADSDYLLGSACQSWRSTVSMAQPALLLPAAGLASRHRGWRHGLCRSGDSTKIRDRWRVTVLTKLKADMNLIAPFEAGPAARCSQGQSLTWLGLEARDQLHWFGVTDPEPLCLKCWEQSRCPRQFSYAPADHEILFGQLPLASRVAKVLLEKVRPWIEPAQSYEKNQLGLKRMFLNSLQLTWVNCLLADAIVLLRAHALLREPAKTYLLQQLIPSQLPLNLE